jgi:hypothetical protein
VCFANGELENFGKVPRLFYGRGISFLLSDTLKSDKETKNYVVAIRVY